MSWFSRSTSKTQVAWTCSLVVGLVTSIGSLAQAEPTSIGIHQFGSPFVESLGGARDISALIPVADEVERIRLGLGPSAPGFGLLRGSPARIAAFAKAYPDHSISLAPMSHAKLELEVPFVRADITRTVRKLDGTGVLIGIVDTGLDVGHPDFLRPDGSSRVAFFLDLANPPRPDNADDKTWTGRVFSGEELSSMIRGGLSADDAPNDKQGHGTHVAGIAAGSGGLSKKYVGMAPGADLIIVRAGRTGTSEFYEADMLLGARFVFEKARELKKPAVVNLSIGSQFGSHDGTSAFEIGLSTLALGPGRAVVVAASNEGGYPIHTSVRVGRDAPVHIPFSLPGSNGAGAAYRIAQVYGSLRTRGGALDISIARDGVTWIGPQPRGTAARTKPSEKTTATLIHDLGGEGGVAPGSQGAIFLLEGALPVGSYDLVLSGDAFVDVWLQGALEAIDGAGMPGFDRGAQVEGTIGVPASASGVIAAGSVDVRETWVGRGGTTLALDRTRKNQRSWFSSAGPSATGAFRPDILAPGSTVISALSRAIRPGITGDFPLDAVVDENHAALSGTSMSAPFVAGAIALLLQRDPTLSQEQMRALLMAGARAPTNDASPGVSAKPYAEGAGVLDIDTALESLERGGARPKATPANTLILRPSSSHLRTGGEIPTTVLAIARDAAGEPADLLNATVTLDGARLVQSTHPTTGLYVYTFVADGSRSDFARVLFAGSLGEIRLRIGADRFDALYGLGSVGGCSTTHVGHSAVDWNVAFALLVGLSVCWHQKHKRHRTVG